MCAVPSGFSAKVLARPPEPILHEWVDNDKSAPGLPESRNRTWICPDGDGAHDVVRMSHHQNEWSSSVGLPCDFYYLLDHPVERCFEFSVNKRLLGGDGYV